jgi:hypothetical protein
VQCRSRLGVHASGYLSGKAAGDVGSERMGKGSQKRLNGRLRGTLAGLWQ